GFDFFNQICNLLRHCCYLHKENDKIQFCKRPLRGLFAVRKVGATYALCFSAMALSTMARLRMVPLSTVARPEMGAFKPPRTCAISTSFGGRSARFFTPA